jgi:hypothetical protein
VSVRDHVLAFYQSRGWDVSSGWPQATPEAEARFFSYTLPRLQTARERARAKRSGRKGA